MMLNRSKKFERENEEIFNAAQHEEMELEINKLKEEVEKLNYELIITESERGEAEDNRKILAHLFENNIIDKAVNILQT